MLEMTTFPTAGARVALIQPLTMYVNSIPASVTRTKEFTSTFEVTLI